jgi:regulator of protease activity HflC (stomatin/prohibitin superfamily)
VEGKLMEEPQKPITLRFGDIRNRYRIPGFRNKGKVVTGLAILALVILLSRLCLVYVQPDEFGIKVVRLGTHRGVQKETYGSGLYFVIPGMQQVYRLPMGVQVLELTNSPATAALSSRQEKAAHIQTSDGFFVDVDVSILYRISDPYLVFTMIGPGVLY